MSVVINYFSLGNDAVFELPGYPSNRYPSGKLHILDIPEVGNISYLSNISIEGRPTEML